MKRKYWYRVCIDGEMGYVKMLDFTFHVLNDLDINIFPKYDFYRLKKSDMTWAAHQIFSFEQVLNGIIGMRNKYLIKFEAAFENAKINHAIEMEALQQLAKDEG